MEEKKIQEVMNVITEWDPLCDEAFDIPDLDNYRTEAIDILFHIDFQNANTEEKVITLLKNILNEAFDLILSREDCIQTGKKIYEIVRTK